MSIYHDPKDPVGCSDQGVPSAAVFASEALRSEL